MEIKWDDGFSIATAVNNGAITISANREGLTSLARLLQSLADAPPGTHIHLDQYNSLDDNSPDLIIDHTCGAPQ